MGLGGFLRFFFQRGYRVGETGWVSWRGGGNDKDRIFFKIFGNSTCIPAAESVVSVPLSLKAVRRSVKIFDFFRNLD